MAIELMWIVLYCCTVTGFAVYPDTNPVDLCERIANLEPNGRHLPTSGDSITVYVNWDSTGPTIIKRCLMKFSACSNCRLRVKLLTNFTLRRCPISEPFYRDAYYQYNNWCVPGCTYLHLFDEDYSNLTALSFSNEPWISDYITESSNLYLVACSNKSEDLSINTSFLITAEDRIKEFQGSSFNVSQQPLKAPFFPVGYALNNEIYTYIFQAETQDEFVTVSFDDWQLSPYSTISFDDANIIGTMSGSSARPWVISNSYRLKMTFNTGEYRIPGTFRSFPGFKATYLFYKNADRVNIPNMITSCGNGLITDVSGNITFNPVSNRLDYYDCVWVIKRNARYEKISVKIIKYSTSVLISRTNQPNFVEIHEGLTSMGTLVESALPNDKDMFLDFKSYTSKDGFYVRLKGHYFGPQDFVLSFTNFNYDDCRYMFMCQNSRCIPSNLKCDGIDNCDDYSDEQPALCTANTGVVNRQSVSVGIIIPIVVSIFLVIVLILLIVFIRRCRRLSNEVRREQRQQHHIATISESVSQGRHRNRRRGARSRNRDDPCLEPPPTYEEVLNTTPIGHLNFASFDLSATSSTGLIQPPSYEEAISPITPNAPLFNDDHDLSTDSSSPETIGRSRSYLSTSSSSDDMHVGEDRRQQRRRRHVDISVSSDSSEEFHAERQRDHNEDDWGNIGQVINEDSVVPVSQNDVVIDQSSSRRSIAKPNSENYPNMVDISPSTLGTDKDPSSSNVKPKNRKRHDSSKLDGVMVPTSIINTQEQQLQEDQANSADVAMNNFANSNPAVSHPVLIYQIEDSPLILAPLPHSPRHLKSSRRNAGAASTSQEEWVHNRSFDQENNCRNEDYLTNNASASTEPGRELCRPETLSTSGPVYKKNRDTQGTQNASNSKKGEGGHFKKLNSSAKSLSKSMGNLFLGDAQISGISAEHLHPSSRAVSRSVENIFRGSSQVTVATSLPLATCPQDPRESWWPAKSKPPTQQGKVIDKPGETKPKISCPSDETDRTREQPPQPSVRPKPKPRKSLERKGPQSNDVHSDNVGNELAGHPLNSNPRSFTHEETRTKEHALNGPRLSARERLQVSANSAPREKPQPSVNSAITDRKQTNGGSANFTPPRTYQVPSAAHTSSTLHDVSSLSRDQKVPIRHPPVVHDAFTPVISGRFDQRPDNAGNHQDSSNRSKPASSLRNLNSSSQSKAVPNPSPHSSSVREMQSPPAINQHLSKTGTPAPPLQRPGTGRNINHDRPAVHDENKVDVQRNIPQNLHQPRKVEERKWNGDHQRSESHPDFPQHYRPNGHHSHGQNVRRQNGSQHDGVINNNSNVAGHQRYANSPFSSNGNFASWPDQASMHNPASPNGNVSWPGQASIHSSPNGNFVSWSGQARSPVSPNGNGQIHDTDRTDQNAASPIHLSSCHKDWSKKPTEHTLPERVVPPRSMPVRVTPHAERENTVQYLHLDVDQSDVIV